MDYIAFELKQINIEIKSIKKIVRLLALISITCVSVITWYFTLSWNPLSTHLFGAGITVANLIYCFVEILMQYAELKDLYRRQGQYKQFEIRDDFARQEAGYSSIYGK